MAALSARFDRVLESVRPRKAALTAVEAEAETAVEEEAETAVEAEAETAVEETAASAPLAMADWRGMAAMPALGPASVRTTPAPPVVETTRAAAAPALGASGTSCRGCR